MSKTKYIKIRKQNPELILNLKSYLANSNIENKMVTNPNTNPNINYNTLHDIIVSGIRHHLPTKTVKFNKHKHKGAQWVTIGIIKSIKFRDKLYLKLKCTPSETALYNTLKINLKIYNKMLKKLIRTAKNIYYHSIFAKYKNDIKNTWITIKSIFNKSHVKKFPDCFNINNVTVKDTQTIANKFNEYFTNIGPSLASKINPPANKSFKDYLINPPISDFNFKCISYKETINVINRLKTKSSSGFDGLSTKLLKEIKWEIHKPLTIIINQSFSQGIFPDKLKLAKVLPFYKKGDECIFDNYRPISILPAISKIFEKIMFEQIHTYFSANKLYYNHQYGFRQNHSTEHASLELSDQIIYAMDRGETPLTIFMDLSKAFDTIDYTILLNKLKHYGFSQNSLSLINNYLNERYQYVDYNDHSSDSREIHTGVPQGSILGPILFIIYINDLNVASNIFRIIIYADDTTLFTTLNTFEKNNLSQPGLINELKKINDWLKLNKLSLNINKTKYIIFRSPQKAVNIPIIKIDNITIESVENFNFLGITFDKYMKWNIHIDNITKKISKAIGILNKLKHTLPGSALKTIYDSLIHSHLCYGILTWGYNLTRIKKIQKRAIRLISNKKYNAHTQPLFRKLNILVIEDIFTHKLYCLYYKLKNNQLPTYLQNLLQTVIQQDFHDHNTRSVNYVVPKTNHTFADKCIKIQLPIALNKQIAEIINKVNTHSYSGYSHYVKKLLISNYEQHCFIHNCYICN